MPQPDAKAAEEDDSQTPFAIWLNSVVVPVLFPNDAALAREMGVPQSYIYRWRRGVVPQVRALTRLAKVTGTSLETLLRIAGYQPENETP